MKLFEKRKIKGAISIFLVIILIPVLLFSAVLIDGSRMASAKAMSQEAADLAAASALADYNQKLKDEYGLFAIKDSEKLTDIYKESLSASLLAAGISADEDYTDRVWGLLKDAVTGTQEDSYKGKSFLNLYDFSVNQCKVEPLYPLAEQNVLENQMVEYAKFRGLYVMGDRLDLFSKLSELKQEAEKNNEASKVMKDKMDADEKNAAADKKLTKLREKMEELNRTVSALNTAREDYLVSLRARMEEVRIENTDTEDELSSEQETAVREYKNRQKTLKDAAKNACKAADEVLQRAKDAEKEVEKAIQRLESFQSKNQGKASGNEAVTDLVTDAKENITNYKDNYLPAIQNLLNDTALQKMKEEKGSIKGVMEHAMEQIEDAVTAYIEVIEELREEMENEDSEDGEDGEDEDEEITEYYYQYLNSNAESTDADAVLRRSSNSYQSAISNITNYFHGKTWDPELLNPSRQYAGVSTNKISEDFAKQQSGNTGSVETNQEGEAEKGEIEQSKFDVRPSKNYTSEQGKTNKTDFYDTEKLDASKNILTQGGSSMILDLAETMRDDVLGVSYLFGTFKTRLTGVKKFTESGMSQSDKDSFYMPKWRYAHPEGELDMRFEPKKDRKTVLRSEIEYLVYGNRTDTANEAAVYATILAERLANNLLAMYLEKQIINPACHNAAKAASAATLGSVPEPVFFWIFLTAWATAETVIEMNYLIDGGYKIPLIKTKKNILLKDFPDSSDKKLITNYGATNKTVLVSYEDYLLILLLVKGKKTRLARATDLIEFNMKNDGQESFSMAKAYTWLHADTELSIRYLFGAVAPFKSYYESSGAVGRMNFTNTIYQGY